MIRFRPAETLLVAALVLGTGTAFAEEESIGSKEYKAYCAVCHGLSGKGDGPYTELLRRTTPDLTLLSRDNNGVFPFEHVMQVIDGRADVAAHGPRTMPVWGHRYQSEAVEDYARFYGPYSAEDIVRSRILALTYHLYTLQAD